MGMTMTQKILAAHAGLDSVEPGQLIEAKLDVVLGNDITSPVAINEFEKCGASSVFDNTRIALVMDHLRRIRTLRRRSSAGRSAASPENTALRIFLMWGAWALSTRCCRKRA